MKKLKIIDLTKNIIYFLNMFTYLFFIKSYNLICFSYMKNKLFSYYYLKFTFDQSCT